MMVKKGYCSSDCNLQAISAAFVTTIMFVILS